MEKIIIWGEDLFGDQSVLLISHSTGIYYNFQCAGVSCMQVYKEGFVLPAFNLLSGYDECSNGCSYIGSMPQVQKKMSYEIDKILIKETEHLTFKLRFDFDRIKELIEGCIPVIYNGTYMGEPLGKKAGYLFTGNCD